MVIGQRIILVIATLVVLGSALAAQEPPSQTYVLRVTGPQAVYLLNVLAERPIKEGGDLFNDLRSQINQQNMLTQQRAIDQAAAARASPDKKE